MEILKKMPAMREEKSPREDRIVLLSDGVFAIAMTLLILDVRLPEGPSHGLFSVWPFPKVAIGEWYDKTS